MTYYQDDTVTLHHGDSLDVLRTLADGSVDCCVTSPPYLGLRDYGVDGQIGLESTPDEYITKLRDVFHEVRRVLTDNGVLFLNLGDSYSSGNVGRQAEATPAESPRASACGTDDTARSDSPATGFAYSDLCDGCQGSAPKHNAGTDRPPREADGHVSRTTRGNAIQDSAATPPAASPLDAPVSTIPGSSQPPPVACSHCGNCGACLSVLATSNRDAQACAYRAAYMPDTSQTSLAYGIAGKDVSDSAWGNSTKAARKSRRRDKAPVAAARGLPGGDLPAKNLMLMPHRVAMALQADGWILRNAIVWNRSNAMPESVTDRLSTRYEMLFMFSKSRRYWFDLDPIREVASTAERTGTRRSYPAGSASSMREGEHQAMTGSFVGLPLNPLGRNPGDVWEIPTTPFPGSHFAVFPPELPRRCIVAACKPGGVVLDPFHGSGTTGMVATRNGRKYVGIELNAEYLDLSLRTRLADGVLDFDGGAA